MLDWKSALKSLRTPLAENFDRNYASTRRKIFSEFFRSGKAKLIQPEKFKAHEENLRGRGDVKLDDFHVIAFANASGARLLYTEDKSLMDDFTNKDLISRPRGKVYSRAEHANLLNDVRCGRQSKLVSFRNRAKMCSRIAHGPISL